MFPSRCSAVCVFALDRVATDSTNSTSMTSMEACFEGGMMNKLDWIERELGTRRKLVSITTSRTTTRRNPWLRHVHSSMDYPWKQKRMTSRYETKTIGNERRIGEELVRPLGWIEDRIGIGVGMERSSDVQGGAASWPISKWIIGFRIRHNDDQQLKQTEPNQFQRRERERGKKEGSGETRSDAKQERKEKNGRGREKTYRII